MEQSIAIDVPVRDVYSQWTRFDWKREVAGRSVDWSVAILELEPDRRIAWQSRGGARVQGVVDFKPLGVERTWVALRNDCEPVSLLRRLGGSLGFVASAVARELRRFKETMEAAQLRLTRSRFRQLEIDRFRGLIGNQDQPPGSPPVPPSDPSPL